MTPLLILLPPLSKSRYAAQLRLITKKKPSYPSTLRPFDLGVIVISWVGISWLGGLMTREGGFIFSSFLLAYPDSTYFIAPLR